ncbi:MAG: hypothetical protein ACON4I_01715 [Candidatus Puniceispirillaceae bacterium]
MANRKTPKDTDGVIEGVAVEKQTTTAKSTRAKSGGDTARGPSGPRQDKQQEPRTAGQTSGQTSGQSSKQSSKRASGQAHQTIQPAGRRRFWSAIAVLAGLGILSAGYFGLQTQQDQQAEIDRQAALEAQIAILSDRVAATELAHQALLRQQQDLDKLLSGRAAAIAADIAERIDAIATRLAMLEAAETARAEQEGDTTNPAMVMPALSSEMLLAQTGLAALNAIMGDNSQGLDLARWLPSLRALADAGLRVGDLDALEKAIAVTPPSTAQLLADGRRLPRFADRGAIATDADADMAAQANDGLWSSLLDGLSGFVTLQKTDNPTPATPPADQLFQAALSAGQLAQAAALVAGMPPDPQRDEWRAAAEARLLVDNSLADMVVALTGDLARLVTPVEGQ